MVESTISLTDFKRNLGQVVNRAAYGRERIVLLSRGKPHAALVSIQDLDQLMALAQEAQTGRHMQQQLDLLAEMDNLRTEMDHAADSVKTLHEVREERLSGLTSATSCCFLAHWQK